LSSLPTMATLLPPPKRQKLYHGIPEPEPEAPKSSKNILVQFVSEDDGSALAPAVNLPADVSREGLEVLVNKLTVSLPLVYAFYFLEQALLECRGPCTIRIPYRCPRRF